LQEQGFCVYPHRLVSESTCRSLHKRIPKLFAGEFETGVYPDEWHWREGISKQDGVTREMCNVWKSDRLVASIILQESLGKLVAQIMDWPSVRIAQDDLIWKPPCISTIDNNSVVGFHQDSAYISSQFEPCENNSVTVWMALDDTDEETGCVQYAVGSHKKWKEGELNEDVETLSSATFHGSGAESYQDSLPSSNNMSNATIVSAPVSQGYALFHHQNVWHGSGPNLSATRHRRALVGHYLRGDVHFADPESTPRQTPWGQASYIYGRYKRFQSVEVDESFFPVIYASPGQGQERTIWLDDYIHS
jgi:hypothetical protein